MSDKTPSLAPMVSPLTEADPNSLEELIESRLDDIFNKKPILLSDDELRSIVAYYQKERERFRTESLEKESKPKTPRGAKKSVPKSISEALQASTDLL